VVLDRNLPGYDVIQADYADGGRLAAEHLIAAGHVDIGVISGPGEASSARQRAEAAIAVVRERANLAWHVQNAFSLDLEPEVTAALETRTATAVIAGADLIAIGAMRHIVAMGLSVPADVSVVGFDDIPWAQLHSPPLTTIDMPVEEMAAAAVETLVRRMANKSEPRRRVMFNVALIERESVRRRT
jgi:LacI family transcriptional regulator